MPKSITEILKKIDNNVGKIIMKRIHPKTGEIFVPHLFRDGKYRVADPVHGNTKHHSINQIAIASETELTDLVKRGFHVRMRGTERGQVNLIKPSEIKLTI